MSVWHRRDVPLKFGIGDRVLFSRHLPLQVRGIKLGEVEEPALSPRPPAEALPIDCSGYFIRALPVVPGQPRLARIDGWLRYVTFEYSHCYIDLAAGPEAYRAKFSAKTRSTITRKVRKFQEHCGGELRWQTYHLPQGMLEYHRLAREVSGKTYQERLLNAGLPADPEFVERMLTAAGQDRVRGYILFDNDKPVAYLYCPIEADAYVYAYLGYDPDYMKLSVGTVLQWLALDDMFAHRGARYFDFTEGQSDHKRLFATHELRCANVMFLRPTLANLLWVRLHIWGQDASSALGVFAERLGLKAKIRGLMRFGWRRASSG